MQKIVDADPQRSESRAAVIAEGQAESLVATTRRGVAA